MKRQLQYTSQKITTRLQRSLARYLGSCSYVKRLLQYSQSKKTKQPCDISLTSHSRAHLTLTLILFSSLLSSSQGLLHLPCTRLRLLVSRSSLLVSASWHECFSHAMLLSLHVYITCMLCILLPLPYMLPYCTCTLLISCFVAPCTYFILYITLLLYTCTAYF